ncbi:hypothetical protein HDZ31DRAFT_31236 [Schizophyllum fasciatum]
MRVKLQCLPPLPALRLWYAVEAEKIGDFKKSLIKNIPGLNTAGLGLQVLLDDFELLDWQTTHDLLRDGDFLVVRRAEKSAASSSSAKSPQSKPDLPAYGTKRKRAPSTSSSSSSSDDTSDESSSNSSDDTSSDDDSDSDDTSSNSSSDSDLDTAPPARSSKKPVKQPLKKAAPAKPVILVPPGQGKTATRERNRRRRAQRNRLSQGGDTQSAGVPFAGIPPPPAALSITNGTSLGDPDTPQSADFAELTMFSLRNKNKSKNFRKNLKVPAGPKRIVFADEPSFAEEPQPTPAARLPRLVPPSERTNLPKNVFVTSVDVEANWHVDAPAYEQEEAEVEAVAHLSYGEEEQSAPPPSPWPALAQKYASAASQPLSTLAQLRADAHVGWMALELNPATMTPEMLVAVAQVTKVDAGEGVITIRRVPRPQEGEAHELLMDVAGEGELPNEEEETFTLKDAVDGGWRVLP